MKLRGWYLASLMLLHLIACDERNHSSQNQQSSNSPYQKSEYRVDQEKQVPELKLKSPNRLTQPLVNRESIDADGVQDESIIGKPEEENFKTEDYGNIVENSFLPALQNPLSTFSIDVDEAAYSNIRRFIQNGSLPPAGAVRIEEMVNYFDYVYPQPSTGEPVAVKTEIASCPWNPDHRLVHIGLKGKEIQMENLPAANLVFLVDVSGSMDQANKLPPSESFLQMLADQLREKDKVAIVVYAGNAGLVLPSTGGRNKTVITDAIENLEAGGSTAGGEGLLLAYKIAKENFINDGNNRIILATDGDFNVGPSSDDEMVRLVEEQRKSGIYLSVLGYGMGNYKDNKMQLLADKGNGNHSYIDNLKEANKILIHEFGSTLFTIAKDVKIQVEFNPQKVEAYRLIGYENRVLEATDFNDDKKDAGEMGSGHTVTALYEIIPFGLKSAFIKRPDTLKYQFNKISPLSSFDEELMTIKLRYKNPGEDSSKLMVHTSKLMVHTIKDAQQSFEKTSDDFRFAAAVAEFGMLLRQSEFKQHASYSQVITMATGAMADDANGYRKEFVSLVRTAAAMTSLKGN